MTLWTDEKKKQLIELVEQHGTDWSTIALKMNISANEVYKTYKNTDWDSFIEDNEDEDVESSLEDISDSTVHEQVQGMLDGQKEKVLNRSEIRKQNELLNKLAHRDIIVEKLQSAVMAVPPISLSEVKYPKGNQFLTRPQEAVLCLSDLHIGLAVEPEDVGNLGNYNVDIFKDRLENLVNTVVSITNHHRGISKLDTLHIFGLGDFVHGSNDAGQWGFINTQQNVCDQIFTAVREVTKAILSLNKVYPNIKFYGVYGNHGRVAKRGKEKLFVNWDYMIYKYLEAILVEQKGIIFLTPRAPFTVANILGNKFFLTHGDQIRGWNGLPFYGMVRAETRYRTVMENLKNMDDLLGRAKEDGVDLDDHEEVMKYALNYAKSFDYMCMGHFHSMAELETSSGGKIILNSSFAGGDDYSINTLQSANKASQKFFGVHEEGKSWTYDIQLDRK